MFVGSFHPGERQLGLVLFQCSCRWPWQLCRRLVSVALEVPEARVAQREPAEVVVQDGFDVESASVVALEKPVGFVLGSSHRSVPRHSKTQVIP